MLHVLAKSKSKINNFEDLSASQLKRFLSSPLFLAAFLNINFNFLPFLAFYVK